MSGEVAVVIVSRIENANELRACIEALRRWAAANDPWRCVVVTEAASAPDMSQVLEGLACEVEAMAPEAEAIAAGPWRQMAAKTMAWQLAETPTELLVLLDDDVEAIAPWSTALFTDQDGRAAMWYRPSGVHPWAWGQRQLFGMACPRDWQIGLPFALRAATLQEFATNRVGVRALELWADGVESVSEWCAIGEWAWREDRSRCRFLNAVATPFHWSSGTRPVFRDWQRRREAWRAVVEEGRAGVSRAHRDVAARAPRRGCCGLAI